MMSTAHRPLSTVFMGTPAFALPSLRALHEAGHDIVAVYTQPPRPAGRGQKERPSPVHEYALAHGLPVFTPVSLKTAEAQLQFANHKADVAVVVAYGLLLPKPILEAYPRGCINVHPSLLPRWRGAAPLQRTVMAGDKETAVVIMQMDEGLDTGDMLLVEKHAVPEHFDAGILHDTLAEKAAPLLLRALAENPAPVKQPADGVTYAKKISKEECKIDWSKTAEEIHNHIRGLSPAPGAYFEFSGEKIKAFASALNASHEAYTPGEVLSPELEIACGQSKIKILEVQRAGKKRMTTREMLQGFDIPLGSILT